MKTRLKWLQSRFFLLEQSYNSILMRYYELKYTLRFEKIYASFYFFITFRFVDYKEFSIRCALCISFL